jgi:Uncharacterised nucleotidyltransferase
MSKNTEEWCRCVIAGSLSAGAPFADDLIVRRDVALLWHRLLESGAAAYCPPSTAAALRQASNARALEAEIVNRELRRVLDAAGDAGITTVAIKGAAIAHTHYPQPYLRARGDSDLVVRPEDRGRLAAVLESCGYAAAEAVDGTLVTQQGQWTRLLGRDLPHTLDVHWQVFNRHAFANVLTADELLERSRPEASLGRHGRVPHPVDALLLACVHRVAHHAGHEDTLWLYDIRLLAESLSAREATEFVRLAHEKHVAAVCANSLRAAERDIGATVPAALQSWLDSAPWQSTREPTAEFLQPQREVDHLVSDLGALPDIRTRARLVWQHLFPRPGYMLQKYGRRSRMLLPYLYVKRIIEGAPRWLRG